MYKLKLNKCLSYHGVVTATQNEPYVSVEEEDIRNYLIESAYFVEVSDLLNEEQENDEGGTITTETVKLNKSLTSFTNPELAEYAKKINVDLSGCTNKEQRIALIKAAENNLVEEDGDKTKLENNSMEGEGTEPETEQNNIEAPIKSEDSNE